MLILASILAELSSKSIRDNFLLFSHPNPHPALSQIGRGERKDRKKYAEIIHSLAPIGKG
jgi:hypothetical protein